MEGKQIRKLGKVVKRSQAGFYACDILDKDSSIVGYAIFSSNGSHVQDCDTIEEALTLVKSLEEKAPI